MKEKLEVPAGEGDAIKVILRVRPPESNCALAFTARVVEVNSSSNSVTLLAKPDPKMFTFDHVADSDSTQESVFSAVGKSLIESCVAGYNGTIFAYGQTGSGKTFTMLGPSEEHDSFKHELRGVIPRSFEHLFNLIHREHELIYQEQVFDLLDPAAANLQLRESIKKGVFVDGLMEQVVSTPTEAYQALSNGWLNRRVAATSMNRESSRSHAVFTLFIESLEEKGGVKNVRQSQLNLVDLAGSERQKDTNTVGIRLKEAGKINQSLSVLGNVIMSLVKITQGRPQHIPYRDSKLTFLLRDSLGGNARTSIVACVHPDAKCFGETLSTLNFAKRAKQIKNKAVINEDTQGNVAHLQVEIKRLRDIINQLQQSGPQPALSAGDGTAGQCQAADTSMPEAWKQNFFEAMLFREQSEQEKEIVQQRLNGYEEELRKKDRMIHSSRMIIKFRESTIAKLEKSGKGLAADGIDNKLVEDIELLKSKLDEFQQMSSLDNQLHTLRAELAEARIRLSATASTQFSSNRLAELHEAFCTLQALNRKEVAMGSPHPADNRSSTALQKLRERCQSLEDENQQLKKLNTEERQVWQSKEASLQADLTATKKMVGDLQQLLEANHLKYRILNETRNILHNQTIKALTPTRATYDLRSRTVMDETMPKGLDLNQSLEMEKASEDILQEALPQVMTEAAYQALSEEIQQLQRDNSCLQQRIDEYDADMVCVRQQIKQLELEKDSLNEMLNSERKEKTGLLETEEKEIRNLKASVDILKSDLNLAKEESADYQVLLHSSDRELKAEKEKCKSLVTSTDHKLNSLETQVLLVRSQLETLERQLEEEIKAREDLEEQLDRERMEKVFLEEQKHSIEVLLREASEQNAAYQTALKADKEAEVSALMQRMEDVNRDCDEKRNQLDSVATQLESAKMSIIELQREVADSREALQQHIVRVQDLKNRLEESQAECSMLKEMADSRSAEVEDARRQLEALNTQLFQKDSQFCAVVVEKEMLNEDLAFYQEQHEKIVHEGENLRQSLDSLEEEKEKLLQENQSLKLQLQLLQVSDRDERLHQITAALAELNHNQAPTSVTSPVRLLDHSSTQIQENRLVEMVEELTRGRERSMEQNQKLEAELVAVKQELTQNATATARCEQLQMQLDNQQVVFKDTIRQMQQASEAELLEAQVLRDTLTETQKKLESFMAEKQQLIAQFIEAQDDKIHAEDELNRLKAVIQKSYVEKDALSSQIEELREEWKKAKEEATLSSHRAQELADFNAVLAGHANHHQKISYLKKLQSDYNYLKQRYDEVAKENTKLRVRVPSSPLKDRTNTKEAEPDLSLLIT